MLIFPYHQKEFIYQMKLKIYMEILMMRNLIAWVIQRKIVMIIRIIQKTFFYSDFDKIIADNIREENIFENNNISNNSFNYDKEKNKNKNQIIIEERSTIKSIKELIKEDNNNNNNTINKTIRYTNLTEEVYLINTEYNNNNIYNDKEKEKDICITVINPRNF